MNTFLYILAVVAGIILLILIIGICLPCERMESRQTIYNYPPEVVYNIITNNNDFAYRSDLKDLVIIDKKGEIEVWDEIAENGNKIRFKTTKKEPYSRYEFDIVEGSGFTGYWIGEFEPTKDGGTLFKSTEIIKITNPFIKIMSYLFFDIGKFMETYQEDVRKKLEGIK
jgi:hypothetical protein